MENMQSCNFVFHGKWGWRIICNEYEDTCLHKCFLFYVPVWMILFSAVGYLQLRIKWSPSCAVVFFIDPVVFNTPGLASQCSSSLGKFNGPYLENYSMNVRVVLVRETLVSHTMCVLTLVNEIHQLHPFFFTLSAGLDAGWILLQ